MKKVAQIQLLRGSSLRGAVGFQLLEKLVVQMLILVDVVGIIFCFEFAFTNIGKLPSYR